MQDSLRPSVAVIGGGPAGLMAAETLIHAGMAVDVYDAMPSLGRKFLQAGVGGLNITHSEPYEIFCSRYGLQRQHLQTSLDRLPPEALRQWVHELGIDTFVGSSGRVFPTQMKAAPLLRAWLHRLRKAGVRLHVRHRCIGWNIDGSLRLRTPEGEIAISPQATVLALGGASWPQLGSDGAWVKWLQTEGIAISPFESANCGFDVAWSPYLQNHFAGSPLKGIALNYTDSEGRTERRQGELMITANGVEGSLIYAFSRQLRERLHPDGKAHFTLDLLPARSRERITDQLSHERGARSLVSHLKSRIGLTGLKVALLHEILDKTSLNDPVILASTIKALPITVHAPRPINEAISTAGGLRFDCLDPRLMIKARPGVFVAGEMLDWEAPTGGYLLTGCFASGLNAGLGVLGWLDQH